MTSWDDIPEGRIILMGLLQVDIAGHSKLQGSTNQLSQAKEIFRRHVEHIVELYGGRLFKWEGDGGAYSFLISEGDEYVEMVLAAIAILSDFPNINYEIAVKAQFNQPLSIRVSCDAGTVKYRSDPSNMTGTFINHFLKHERAIGLLNAVTVTERVLKELPEPLRQKFYFYKQSDEVESKIYRFQKENDKPVAASAPPVIISEDQVLNELREAIKQNESYNKEVEIIRAVRHVPKLEPVGVLTLDDERRLTAQKAIEPFRNDGHAVIEDEPVWNDDPVIIRFKVTDYVYVYAISEGGNLPLKVLSVSVVLLCAEKRELYLHRRSPSSRTYKNCLHTIGGAYIPPGIAPLNDKYDLIAAAQREVREETKMNFSRSRDVRMMLAKEPNTGFIQFVLLGVNVPSEEVDAKENSWEGDIVIVSFDKLSDKLFSDEDRWVPTGKAHVLAWLGLGAPPLGAEARFDGHSAKELFAKAINELKD